MSEPKQDEPKELDINSPEIRDFCAAAQKFLDEDCKDPDPVELKKTPLWCSCKVLPDESVDQCLLCYRAEKLDHRMQLLEQRLDELTAKNMS